MDLSFPSDTFIVLFVSLIESSLFTFSKPYRHITIHIYTEVFQEKVISSTIYCVVYSEVWLILTILLVCCFNRIWLLVKKIYTVSGQPCAYLLLLFASSKNGCSIHISIRSHYTISLSILVIWFCFIVLIFIFCNRSNLAYILCDSLFIVIAPTNQSIEALQKEISFTNIRACSFCLTNY